MNRLKVWQAAVLAAVAVVLAASVIWHGTIGQKPPPIPEPVTKVSQIPGAPSSTSGATPR